MHGKEIKQKTGTIDEEQMTLKSLDGERLGKKINAGKGKATQTAKRNCEW